MCRKENSREDQIARKAADSILNDEIKKNGKIPDTRDSLLDYGSRCLNVGICVQRYYEADSLIKLITSKVSVNNFLVKEYTKAYSNISSNGNFNWEENVSEQGYFPVGVVGFSAARAGLCCEYAKLTNIALGSCTLKMHAKNTTSSTIQASTARLVVLWIKVHDSGSSGA